MGGYVLKGGTGVYMLLDPETGDPRATIISQGNGTWRARTLDGEAKTYQPPDEIERPAVWVAEQFVPAAEPAAEEGTDAE
ncbi:hypothetical protein AGRA3207_001405 [Actinomadura graeca]|uniref:Uncharacterized protein n=1 Tax=Actinomadura graeca TaxID=2750812 RepID=A0ABX8QPE3_9ACTN|nr:hypothetical protein [Actinomadura graeca]QXJ20653.1 hypothetical protein AGRA3207_001405 [Actinomadura graeca]